MSGHVEKYAKPANVEEYVRSAVQGFLGDPPDTEFQRGYLASLLVLAEEALGLRMDLPPFAEAHKLCFSAQYRVNRARRDLASCMRQVEELIEECE
jgi:hypothetical protein